MSDLPVSPSDLSWWGWMLVSIGAFIVTTIAGALMEEAFNEKHPVGGCLGLLVTVFAGLVGAATLILGLVRFVKWAWRG